VEASYSEDGLQEALAMVSAELLENAVKYGRPDANGIQFSMKGGPDQLEVAVTNATSDDPRHIDALVGRVTWLGGFADPAQAYREALEEIYQRAVPANGAGGLGIVRIAHEGGCRVSVDTSRPGWITVRAWRSVVAPQAPASDGGRP
jgi:hypothetical protein